MQHAEMGNGKPHMKLLILEDDSKLLAILSHHLTVAGHHVRTATTCRSAGVALAAEACDMVVTSWKVSDMSGAPLCEALRAASGNPGLYIIMLNAPHSDAGAQDYIPKPFDLGRLMASIRTGMLAVSAAAA
jgi:DNA-binding response OmpR family regulator